MAGNFWHSSHFQQWILDKQDLLRERQTDLKLLDPESPTTAADEYQKIMIFFANFIQTLGEHAKVRQQVIATATVYFKRFYCRNSLKSIDPLLMAPTCIFLASKVEEFGVISNNRLMQTCQQVVRKFLWAFAPDYPYKIQNVLECEFYLLEMMDCCLILFHPYRPLLQYAQDLCGEDTSLLKLAWRVVNDSLRTDVCLLYPPYTIALAALYIASVIQNKDTKQWFAQLNVDMEKILEITKVMLKLYDMWNGYKEQNEVQAILNKIPKPKQSSSRPPSQGPNGQDGQNQSAQGQTGQESQG